MAMPDSLKIAYIGGGSRFVVVLLHGLAGEDADGLTKALMAWTDVVPVKPLLDLAGELPKIME